MSVRRHLRASGPSNWHYTLDRVQGQRKNAEHAEAQRTAEKLFFELVDETMESVHEFGDVEVDQQTEAYVTQPQVC